MAESTIQYSGSGQTAPTPPPKTSQPAVSQQYSAGSQPDYSYQSGDTVNPSPEFFEQAGEYAKSGVDFVINSVEKLVNPEKTQSISLAEIASKGEYITPWERSQLEGAGYKYTPTTKEVWVAGGPDTLITEQHLDPKFVADWRAKWNKPVGHYETQTTYAWVKGNEVLPVATVTPKPTNWNPLQGVYQAGYDFGRDVLKPTLQDTGLYDPTKAALYDAYSRSPIKYIPEPTMDTTIDVSTDTLRMAQAEGVPVTYSGGKFTINAQGADYDKYSARLNEIQLTLFNQKKIALENEYNNQKRKRETSIFGTGLTWDDSINSAAASLLPKSWTPKKEVLDYENSNKPGSQLLKGFTEAYGDWYNKKVAVVPVNVLTGIGVEAAMYAPVGLAIKGGTILLRTGAEAGAGVLSVGAEAAGAGITGRVLSVGSRALSLGSTVEETSIAGRALNAVVNASGKVAAGTDTAADVLKFGASRLNVGSRYIEPATNAVMTYQVGSDLASSKSYKEGFEKTAGLVVGGIGYKAGAEGVVKAYDVARTKGMSEIPIADIVNAKVLSGQNKFPMIERGSTPKDVIEMFKTSEGTSKGYHATPAEFSDTTNTSLTQKRKTDMPGLYVSPEESGPSVNFTRVSKTGASPYRGFVEGVKQTSKGVTKTSEGIKQTGRGVITGDLSEIKAGAGTVKAGAGDVKAGAGNVITSIVGGSQPLKPAILHIELSKGVERLPEESRYNVPYDKEINGNIIFENSPSRQFYQANAGTGRTFLTPVLERSLKGGGGPEAEAVITPGTKLVKTGAEGYINFNGRRIPVISYTTSEPGVREVSAGLNSSKNLPTGHNEFGNKINDVMNIVESGSEGPLFRPGQAETAARSKQFRKSEAWNKKQNQKPDIIETKASELKNSYSYEPVNNKGILSDIGYVPKSSYGPSPSSVVSGVGVNVVQSYIPTVKSPSDLHSTVNSQTDFVSGSLRGVISEIESESGSTKYSRTLPGSSSVVPRSVIPGISKISGTSDYRRVSPGDIVSGLSPSSPGRTPSRITPSSIISGLTPSNPTPDRPSRITPSSIISGLTPSNPTPDRPSRVFPERIIPGITPSNPTPERSTIRSHSSIYTPSPGPDYRIIKFDKSSPKDEYKPKKLAVTGISGTMKRGYLKNQFGSLEGFAKKAFSGDKVGFKKIKLK